MKHFHNFGWIKRHFSTVSCMFNTQQLRDNKKDTPEPTPALKRKGCLQPPAFRMGAQQFALIHGFACWAFSHQQPTVVWKYYMENSRKKQLASFRLKAVLSGVTMSPTPPSILPRCESPLCQAPACGIHSPPVRHLAVLVTAQLSQRHGACVWVTLVLPTHAPECKCSDEGRGQPGEAEGRNASFQWKGESSTLRHFERDHIHIASVIVYCYNCSILS